MGVKDGSLLFSSPFQWPGGNRQVLLEPKVTPFPSLECYARRGHSRQKNILIHERNLQSESLPSFFFFSLDEESIGQCLLAKLMWFRAIRRHSNQIKLLPAQIKLPEQRNAFYASGPLHVLSPLCLERVSLSLHYSSSLGWLKSSFRPHLFREWFRDSTHPPTIRWLVCALAVHLHTSMLPCFSCLHNSDSSFTIFLSQLFCNLSENFTCLSHCGVCA